LPMSVWLPAVAFAIAGRACATTGSAVRCTRLAGAGKPRGPPVSGWTASR
jgi:hypothetical protein